MPTPDGASTDLRSRVLSLSPDEIGIAPSAEHPRVWGILMEIGYEEATASLVALLDGTVSLYFSNGGGIIGAGEHESVRREAFAFIDLTGEYLDALSPAESFPLPDVGRVRFYVLTFEGVLGAEADEEDLGEERHELSRLFYAGQDVLTAIREVDPADSDE